MTQHKILIIGGGFGGVKCAQKLAKMRLPKGTEIRLVSDRENFEYHGALYRVAAGNTPLEVCFPLHEILNTEKIDIVHDRIAKIDKNKKFATGKSGSTYYYDILVIALGAQTVYFGIPGLRENAYGMKSIERAIGLKNHIVNTIEHCAHGTGDEKVCGSNFVVVGGGATGVEVAGEIMQYARKLSVHHGSDPALVHVDLIEAQERILGLMPESFAKRMHRRLSDMGINVMTGTAITQSEAEGVMLKGKHMESKISAKTVIWTAGVRAHRLIEESGFTLGAAGKAQVCAHLHAHKHEDIFIIGDAADTQYSGMAQTALRDATFVAKTISRTLRGKPLLAYKPRGVLYAVPAGPGWAGACIGRLRVFGFAGWWMRRILDLIVFIEIAPLPSALRAFFARHNKQDLCTDCKKG